VAGFRYHGKVRTFEPWGLFARDGFWYAEGHDRDAGERRLYRVDRIEGTVDVGPPGAFERPAGYRAGSWSADIKDIGEGERRTARVLVDGDRAWSAVVELGDEAVRERRPDGAVVAEVPCTNVAAFRSWVLGFLEHAEVLEPADVRAAVVAWLEEMARP
jgi:predicted DNA-binding transcriptional regulator YafY